MKTIKINRLDYLLSELERDTQYFVIIDSTVSKAYPIKKQFCNLKLNACFFELEATEDKKTLTTVEKIMSYMLEKNLNRNVKIVAIGGGIIGDIAGLVSLLYMRGVDLIMVPTTLLAQVDSCYGGKVGVDLKSYKNIIGGFKMAEQILIDTNFLKTLDSQTISEGSFEILKYAILLKPELLNYFSRKENYYQGNIDELVYDCLLVKDHFIKDDLYDKNQRAMLNLGHLYAHAIEKASNFTISHGKAVGYGILLTAQFSFRNEFMSYEDYLLIEKICHENAVFLQDLNGLNFEQHLNSDKNCFNEQVLFTVIIKPGTCILKKLLLSDIKEAIECGQ